MYKIVFIAMITLITGCAEPAADYLIVAHRGASQDAPENTIPSFLLAWEQGADAIEGDFFLTADQEIVCIHDSRTGRFSDVNLIVSESTLEELRQIDVGAWKDDKWSGTVIPSLAGVFETVPRGKKIFVEIKQSVEILPKLYGEIDRSGLKNEQIVIISFNSDVIKAVKRDRPEHKAYWLSGLSYDNHGNVVPGPETVIETLESTGADGFSSHHGLVTREFIEQITDAGYEYHVWTVNDPERAWELKEFGALSITTDVPGLIREYFQKQ